MLEHLIFQGPYTDKDFFNFVKTSLEPRHRWYYFKEGFSSNVVKEAINSNRIKNKQLNILDVFNGCGTTMLTSSLLGHQSTGIEINPFLEFTSIVKTSSFFPKKDIFFQFANEIVNKSKGGSFSELEGVSTFTMAPGLEKWLFNTSVIRRFSAMSEIIDTLPKGFKNIFKFIALVSIMECSNARKDGKSLRYKTDWKSLKYSSSDVAKEFLKKCHIIYEDIYNAPINNKFKPKLLLGDSRKVLTDKNRFTDKFDLLITSPPYLNSFDYSDIYRAELFLGGFVNNNEELRKIRLRTLRSHVQVNWEQDINFESAMLRPYIEQIEVSGDYWNNRIPLMIKAYFDDLYSVMSNVKNHLNRNAEAWIVVSTSAYAGIHIPVDLLLADIACQLGYKLRGIHCLRYLRSSSQQFKDLNNKKTPLRESLIILKK